VRGGKSVVRRNSAYIHAGKRKNCKSTSYRVREDEFTSKKGEARAGNFYHGEGESRRWREGETTEGRYKQNFRLPLKERWRGKTYHIPSGGVEIIIERGKRLKNLQERIRGEIPMCSG